VEAVFQACFGRVEGEGELGDSGRHVWAERGEFLEDLFGAALRQDEQTAAARTTKHLQRSFPVEWRGTRMRAEKRINEEKGEKGGQPQQEPASFEPLHVAIRHAPEVPAQAAPVAMVVVVVRQEPRVHPAHPPPTATRLAATWPHALWRDEGAVGLGVGIDFCEHVVSVELPWVELMGNQRGISCDGKFNDDSMVGGELSAS
jgi:hypothetical protein